MPEYRRRYVDGHPVFVTVVTHRRRPWLADEGCAELLLDAMRRIRARHPFRHLAHVVMPDHLHWIFTPRAADFSATVAALKREVTWRLKAQGRYGPPPYWQNRFYDHIIRNERDLRLHLDYVHYNPAKHGLGTPGGYRFSSFHEWQRRGVYDADWASAVPDAVREMELE